MKTSRIFTVLSMLCAAVAVWSCTEPEPEAEPEAEPEIKVTGVTNSITFQCDAPAKTFNVKANYDWTASVDGASWLTLEPKEGAANEVVSVTLTPQVNEARETREAKLTISIKDKDFSKEIAISQFGYDGPAKDTHAEGTVFFQDDFNWIAGIWPEKLKNSKGGWYSVKLDGTNYNEFSLKNGYDDVDKVFDEKGYTYNADNSTYCRYDGSIKLGRAAMVGYICTPALAQIDKDAVATLCVTFDASIYVAANNTPSANQYVKLQIVGDGEFKTAGTKGCEISSDGKTITVPTKAEYKWKWVRKQVVVTGATAATAIQFGVAEAVDARSFVDNIVITRVADNATPAEDAVQPDAPFAKEIGTANEELYLAAGSTGEFTATINREWKASTTADWITFVSATAGKSGDKNGNVVAEDKKSVDVCGSGCPYVISFTVAENTVEQPREAVITITSEGQEQGTVTVKQAAAKPATKVDSHAPGYEFLNENFNWITAMYPVGTYSYWGWPSTKTNGSVTNDQQITKTEFAPVKAELDKRGWTYDATETYPRYEGYLRIGRAAQRGSVTTPALAGIDADAQATLDVAFNIAMYASAGSIVDTINMYPVSLIGPGKIVACGSPVATIAEGGKSAEILVENDETHIFVWNRKHFIVAEATAETSIKFGKGEAKSNTRYFFDDVVVSRVADGTTSAAADAIVLDPLSMDFKLLSTEPVAGEGGEVDMSLRANRAYSVVSDSEWLTIKTIEGAGEKGGVSIAENKLSATVKATGLEYCSSKLAAAPNTTGAAREGHVTVTVEGETPVVLTVSQAAAQGTIVEYGEPVEIAKWTFTSLYETFTHTDGKTYTNENEAAQTSIKNWKAKQPVESDVVKGGTLSATQKDGTSTHSGGTATQIMNRMRFNNPSVGDSFDFTLTGLTLPKDTKIEFKHAFITGTNGDKCPGQWVEEYSLDGTNWTAVGDTIKVAKPNPATKDDATYLDCEFVIPQPLNAATLYFRVRISSDITINGKNFNDGYRDIVYIGARPYISSKSFADRLKTYTDDDAYLTFTAAQPK